MIRFSTKELRLITGIPAKNLYNYKKRGHLIKDEDKTYSYDDPINIAFIETYGIPGQVEKIIEEQNKPPAPKKKPIKKPVKKPAPKKETKKTTIRTIKKATTKKPPKEEKVNLSQPPKPEPKEVSELTKVNLEQKKLAIKKAKAEYELKELELQQKKGSLIDLNQTMVITKAYAEGFTKDADQRIKTLIQDICARHGIDSGKAGEYKLKATKIMNKSNDSAIKLLLKEFDK